MAVRYLYTLRDERLMWEYIFERLQDKDETAYQPKGLKLWKNFEATQKTNKTASSLASHFRKVMYDHIEEARIPFEQKLYIISQLNISLSKRQQKTIEHRENITIALDDSGFVTAYEKEGKRYFPSLLKKRISCGDGNIEEGYDAFELNGSVSKIAKLSQSSDNSPVSVAYSKHYNLRKRLSVENGRLSKTHNLEEAETVNSIIDNSDCNDNRNKDQYDDDNDNERSHGNQIRCAETTESESDMNQCVEVANNREGLTADNDQFGVNHGNLACSNTSTSTAALARKKEFPAFEDIIDEEAKQLLAYILSKRQLKGVEKMKTEKILELRANEAKRIGIGLRSHLRKMQQRMV